MIKVNMDGGETSEELHSRPQAGTFGKLDAG